MAEKKNGKKKELTYKNKDAYELMTKAELKRAYDFAEEYKKFIDECKTERECAAFAKRNAEKLGFKNFEYGRKYRAGDKIIFNNRNKAVYLFVVGRSGLENGIDIAVAHIDSPRLDVKQVPLYEEGGMAYLKTHYYGGLKKYQWLSTPLALHGTIVRKDMSTVDINVGENDDDPVFYITDLLIHLASEQMTKPLSKAISGENLNILVGSRPIDDKDAKDRIKLGVLKILNEKYSITEDDFISAELSLVPAGRARDVGFDRSLICAYGHDDRVCAYPILSAAFEASKTVPERSFVCVLSDKEETGSDGNTGMQSFALWDMLNDIAESMKINPRKMFENSKCISSDVNACYDPNFPEVYDAKNSAYINKGVCVTKFTGARGKSGTSDANAEYVGFIRKLFDENHVVWQTGELGKVDAGGGGTVAMFVANHNIDTIDVGVPVLSMHAPYELISKTDLYSEYKGVLAFFKMK